MSHAKDRARLPIPVAVAQADATVVATTASPSRRTTILGLYGAYELWVAPGQGGRRGRCLLRHALHLDPRVCVRLARYPLSPPALTWWTLCP